MQTTTVGDASQKSEIVCCVAAIPLFLFCRCWIRSFVLCRINI
ncbi:hypothetical protein T07_8872 [Trichinella nelsoni]|uniref:Uncharacterized protein n=1 Tax=Trichinella nelsoni TaxID=6336 RepID=A0A0V0RAN9_9BILA|nr:hypothetical protein T07_8872 [Trichinella nelsoni]